MAPYAINAMGLAVWIVPGVTGPDGATEWTHLVRHYMTEGEALERRESRGSGKTKTSRRTDNE